MPSIYLHKGRGLVKFTKCSILSENKAVENILLNSELSYLPPNPYLTQLTARLCLNHTKCSIAFNILAWEYKYFAVIL